MALAIGLKFSAGRYHATPWSRHVNEGSPEWPPSPWRLLRAMVAVWQQRTFGAEAAGIPGLIRKLVNPPAYVLPPASQGHSRHYMALFKGEKTLVFDSFIALDRDAEVVALWPDVDLTEAESASLRIVLDRMQYFGRAESWCEARVIADSQCGKPNCVLLHGATDRDGVEPVRILGVDSETALGPDDDPRTWHLCAETSDLRKQRWSDPPGSKWLTYMRPKNCFAGSETKPRVFRGPRIHMVRYALDGPVLPRITETLSIGELARRYLQGIFGKRNGGASSPVLSGKLPNGEPLQGHGHAFYLASDEDCDGILDHLTVFARDGFPPAERRVLDHFRQLRQVGNKPDLNLVLIGAGTPEGFRGVPPFGPSRVWRSATPFVPVRHTKIRGGKLLETPAEQLALEFERRGYPKPVRVAPLERCEFSDGRSMRWIEFRRERLFGGGASGGTLGYGFEVEFEEPQPGPVALGYGCHFGLGQFHALNR